MSPSSGLCSWYSVCERHNHITFLLFSIHQCVCVDIDFVALDGISGDNTSTQCFTIAIIDDNIFELTESFNVSATVLENPSITASTVVSIIDDEGMFNSKCH